MNDQSLERRRRVWEDALILPCTESLTDSAIKELSDYFSKSPEEVRGILSQSEKLLAEEWLQMDINPKDRNSVINFYNNTQLEIFELMNYHIDKNSGYPLNYVCATEIAIKFAAVKYLDYGSGIGSGALVFLKDGFDVTCADISQPLLNFIEYRLRKRKLKATLIDLKEQQLQNNTYDVITCFEILEHCLNPSRILRKLRKALKIKGILIVNNVQRIRENKDKPMHISQVNLEKKLRSFGFQQLWALQEGFKKNCKYNYVAVLRKVDRPFGINKIFYLYDNFCSPRFKKIINKFRKSYSRRNKQSHRMSYCPKVKGC